jgi:hypothetical protein
VFVDEPSGDVHALLLAVDGPESFLVFVRGLIADRKWAENLPDTSPWTSRGGWENDTIAEFLGAAVAWAHDSRFGESQGLQGVSPWRVFATFLYCGKIYE